MDQPSESFSTMQPVFRFAPSPNGHLHLGHAYSALLNARMVAQVGGRFLLRIEDIDTTRCTDRLIQDCLEDLHWLGLDWEEPVLRQSTRLGAYRAEVAKLEHQGLLFPCFCSRRAIAAVGQGAQDPDGAPRYPGTCKRLSTDEKTERIASGVPYAWRLDFEAARRIAGPLSWLEEGESPAQDFNWSDPVLVRKDIGTSYHLAVVVDDAKQGVTHVVRGKDLFAQTAIHRMLQLLLGLPEPVYHHHRLILDGEGNKLAKSAVSTPLRQLRAEGWTPQAIQQRLGL